MRHRAALRGYNSSEGLARAESSIQTYLLTDFLSLDPDVENLDDFAPTARFGWLMIGLEHQGHCLVSRNSSIFLRIACPTPSAHSL